MALTPQQLEILKTLGTAMLGGAGGFGVGKAARPGGRVWNTITRENREGFVPESSETVNLRAAQQLADQMAPPATLDFDAGVVYVPGPAQNNAMLVRSPENLEAFLRQTDAEHRAALEQYLNDPNIPKDRAVQLGIRNEQRLPKWWDDRDPRLPVTPSSSAVSSARIGPDGDIYIRFGQGGKEYQYEGSPDPVEASRVLQELVTAPSIGRAVNSWTGSWGKNHTYLPKG